MSIYTDLQKIRNEIAKMNLKKTGFNKFQNFAYFETKDFLPEANVLFEKYSITPIFNICVEEGGIKYAYLELLQDRETSKEKIYFRFPIAFEPKNMQETGAMVTYAMRYLYIVALSLTEDDVTDANVGNDKQVQKSKVDNQLVSEFVGKYSNNEVKAILEHFKVNNPNQLPEDVLRKYCDKR